MDCDLYSGVGLKRLGDSQTVGSRQEKLRAPWFSTAATWVEEAAGTELGWG